MRVVGNIEAIKYLRLVSGPLLILGAGLAAFTVLRALVVLFEFFFTPFWL